MTNARLLICLRLSGGASFGFELDFPPQRNTITDRSPEQLIGVIDGQSERFEAVAPVIQWCFADVISPQARAADLPADTRQGYLMVGDDDGQLPLFQHHGGKRCVGPTNADLERNGKRFRRHQEVESMPLGPFRLRSGRPPAFVLGPDVHDLEQ